MATIISESDFEEKVIKSEKPVLVDFFASWCGPCQMMSPVIDELASEMEKDAGVYKVDVDASGNLANKYQIMSIPTILIFKGGKVVKQFNGVTSKEDLEKELK
ncbi:MAG: Thioredoxin [candidate division WS2 bacterium ADurb.Bin280]|uniref:Thioredoxin n=1 Tax=candidate division WS2 bacterium ADurb.Bin280 TaxID=1852829 RepID=A0A1V5SGT7_9BACT|nr:MAG: Thioredoxin [candidate division WS2 bacterium ADurb.Bin280]